MIEARYAYSQESIERELVQQIDSDPGAFMLPISYVILAFSGIYILVLLWMKWAYHVAIFVRLLPGLAFFMLAYNTMSYRGLGRRKRYMRAVMQNKGTIDMRLTFDDRGFRRIFSDQIGSFYPWCAVRQLSVVEGGIFVDVKIVAVSCWVPDSAFQKQDGHAALLDLADKHSVMIFDVHGKRLDTSGHA